MVAGRKEAQCVFFATLFCANKQSQEYYEARVMLACKHDS